MLARYQPMLRLFCRDTRGVAAIEMSLCGLMLILGILNVVDVGVYAYKKMQVANAAQVGAQAAWSTCNLSSMLPATQNCPPLNAAITTAIQSTSLGTAVTLASGYPQEGYYCVNSTPVHCKRLAAWPARRQIAPRRGTQVCCPVTISKSL